jgi:hypothetical protein
MTKIGLIIKAVEPITTSGFIFRHQIPAVSANVGGIIIYTTPPLDIAIAPMLGMASNGLIMIWYDGLGQVSEILVINDTVS